MHWTRLTRTLTLGIMFSVLGVGCAAVDALVSSPAGRSANGSSPERLAAIGQMFENQGRLAHAKQMYRSALRSNPQNLIARQRMAAIGRRKATRTFEGEHAEQHEAIVVVQPQAQPAEPIKPTQSIEHSVRITPQSFEEQATALISQHDSGSAAVRVESYVPIAAENVEFVTAETDIGAVAIVDTGWNLSNGPNRDRGAETFSDSSRERNRTDSDIATVAFEDSTVGTATVASMESEWQSSQRLVSLDELTRWMEFPVSNRDNLLHALKFGEEDGVRALAAVALTECPLGDEEINQSLRSATFSGADLLRVTALDSLIQRGALTSDDVESLLGLLRSNDADIQSQSAASLRNLAETEWSRQCVNGLERLLNDRNPSIVAVAATTLGDFGAEATQHKDALRQVAENHQNAHAADSARFALRRIPGDEVGYVAPAHVLPSPDLNVVPQTGEYLPTAN